MHDRDQEVMDIIKKVIDKANERAGQGRAPAFEDMVTRLTTFANQLARMNESKAKHNEEVQKRIDDVFAQIKAKSINAEQGDKMMEDLTQETKMIAPPNGSKPWVLSRLRENDLCRHKQQMRSEQSMR
jgi:methyl-accepting chemotaxis protein